MKHYEEKEDVNIFISNIKTATLSKKKEGFRRHQKKKINQLAKETYNIIITSILQS